MYSVTFCGASPISFSVPEAALSIPAVAKALAAWGRHMWPDLQWKNIGGDKICDNEYVEFCRTVQILPSVVL